MQQHTTGTTAARSGRRRWSTRAAAALLAGVMVGGVSLGVVPAMPASALEVSTERHLLVADPAAQRLYTYRVSDMQLTGQLDGIELASHVGTVVLPDGRVLFVDDAHAQVVVLTIDAQGRPTLDRRIDIPGERPWAGALWGAVDPGGDYFAVTSGYDDSAEQTVTVVDLSDFSVGQLPVSLDDNADGGYDELHVWLTGEPLQVAVTTGGRLRAYPLAAVMDGQTPSATSSVPVGPGTHGPVLSSDGDRLLVTTTEGVDRVRIDGGRLRDPSTLPYPTDPALVQNYRPRLSQDGDTLYGPIGKGQALPPERWAQAQNRLHAVDMATETTRITGLPKGIIGRSAQARQYALFPVISGPRDSALLLDTDRTSTRFGAVLQRIPLEKLSNGPETGISSVGTERRSAAITTSGDRGFVSHGGDGLISVLDTGRAVVSQTVRVPTPLRGGGYLVAVERGRALVDVMAR